MMSIRFLMAAQSPVVPGKLPATAPAGVDFLTLLPDIAVPAGPRQASAGGGKALPAIDEQDDAAQLGAIAWMTLPPLPVAHPPAAASTEATVLPSTARGLVPVVEPRMPPSVIATGEAALPPAAGAPAMPAAPPLPQQASAPLVGETTTLDIVTPTAGEVIPHEAAGDGAGAVAMTPAAVRAAAPREPVDAAASPPPAVLPLVLHPQLAQPVAPRIASAATPSPAPVRPNQEAAAPGDLVLPLQPRAEPRGVAVPVVAAPVMPLARKAAAPASVAETAASGPELLVASTSDAAVAHDVGKQAASVGRAVPAAVSVAEPQPLQPARIAPAAQMFAAAIQRAVRDERRPAEAEPTPGILPVPADLATRAVAAAESSRHAVLDMARETWPAKMIERIEVLRDAADAADTAIRLVPDRLGAIDVSLRKDGDSVQVLFTAQQAETRHLLAEAQPKLVEMAEARGLRLSMHTGEGGGQQNQQQRAAAPQPSTAPGHAAPDDEGTTADGRVA